jgi:hypothetical protein
MSVVLALAIPAFDTAARASSVSNGRLRNFTYNADTKIGHLTIENSKGTSRYKVTRDTDCGYSTGQSGGAIPCRSLGQDKYENKPTRVTWKLTDSGVRKASQVVVDIS